MIIGEREMYQDKERKVPTRVLYILELVRNSGETNMLDKYNVCMYCDMIDHKSGLWLYKFCGGKCGRAYTNYAVVLNQLSDYIKRKNEINNSKTE